MAIDPGAFTNAFNTQREIGMRERAYNDAQAQQQFQNARVTEADAQQRTLFQQGQEDRQNTMRAQSLGRVGSIAQKALSLGDPMQRKQFLKQSITAYGNDFKALGSDTSQVDQMLALPDDQLTSMLQQVSQYAPEEKPITVAEGGMLAQKDPVTGKYSTVLENPKDSRNEVEYKDAGDRLVPVYKGGPQAGQPVPGLQPIAKGKLPGEHANQGFKNAEALRQEYNAQAKEFIGVADSYQRIKDSAANPSAAGDLALIFNYMKVLDPGSTVREGEFATAQNAAGVDGRVVALYNRLRNGERLSEGQRADFVGRADRLYKGQENRFNTRVKDRYTALAKRYGLDPAEIISDPTTASAPGMPRSFATEAEAEAAGLKPGTKVIINGVSGTWQ